VNFLPEENQYSVGEEYCDYINNAFDNTEREVFLDWVAKHKNRKKTDPIAGTI
jgi:hypothetical protein